MVKADESQTAYAKTIQGFPDKVYEGLKIAYKPFEIPGTMLVEGGKKIFFTLEKKNMPYIYELVFKSE